MKELNSVDIHSTAIVHSGAELGLGVKVGPYSLIGKNVKIDDGSVLDSHVVISGRTFIGAKCRLWSFATVGSTPQDLKYRGEDSELICGRGNWFREYSNISLGTALDKGRTSIGNNNVFMVNSHVAHDCVIGNNCILVNGVSLAGHIEVGDNAIIGGHSACHQFIKIGSFAMVGGGSIVKQDILPFTIVAGNHASPKGINVIGLQRNGFTRDEICIAKHNYRQILHSQLTLNAAQTELAKSTPNRITNMFITFIKNRSNRGICR